MEKKAIEKKVSDSIVFTGYVGFDEISSLIQLADVAVATFNDDLYAECKSPLKIYEYMAMGKPIVATNIGQAAEVLEGCAILIPPNDDKALFSAIEKLLDNPGYGQEIGAKARDKFLKKYTWEHTSQKFLNAYEVALNSKLQNFE